MSDKTVKCSFCGTPTSAFSCFPPHVCDSDACNQEAVKCERESEENAREEAARDNYDRYR